MQDEYIRLQSQERKAYHQRQTAFKKYAVARDKCSKAYDAMQSAWNERESTRKTLNREYKAMKETSARFREVWNGYENVSEGYKADVTRLRELANTEHYEMIDCFKKATDCYLSGDKASASEWSQKGHAHKERRNELNSEVGKLCEELRSIKQNTDTRAQRTDSTAFHTAKDAYEKAKSEHIAKEKEFKRLQAERDRLKAEFDTAKAEHDRAKDEYYKKLKEN